MMEDGEVSDTMMTMAVNVTEFASPQHLCIMVQGEDTDDMEAPRIPATTAYTAMGSYMGLENASIGPKPEMQTLGMIGRNGTTVHLPYLTTNAKFSQRVRIVNRGVAALYTIDLQTGDTPEEVEGTLDANSVTDLMVGGDDGIINMIGGGRGATAGTTEHDRCREHPDQQGARHHRHGRVRARVVRGNTVRFGPSLPFWASDFKILRCLLIRPRGFGACRGPLISVPRTCRLRY